MIRPATYKDLDVLVEMACTFFEYGIEDTGLTLDRYSINDSIMDLFENKDSIFLVCEKEEVIGAIAGMVIPWMCNKNIKILHEAWWFVSEEFRTKHPMAGFSLLKSFIKQGKEKGATTMVISSTNRPEAARVREFYERRGLSVKDMNYIGRI